ncbi:carbohydrate ABC transporter membrane protein 2 (CUT1 family) [Tamaricihabitans halophyticus]|uniref:Carbohydrate ABC transporter membrane protein 2 (CUT1 family) n=1 Tax=Tamaricihabitans halophyticus TaxID=1262583 RepID=A0A4R2QY05_9PSEU|nr:carbohydrate ABC transporter permease [Tamaricihabitans halophyticus]TCP55053.1 carbohydrate ABC transporter membrane protein 2 (CUT1 family) [Tamaricihabitans halophyticus]
MTTTLTTQRTSTRRPGGQRFLHWVAVHSLGIALGLMFALPVLFVLLTAVMTDQQALTADLWPREWRFDNFATVFEAAPMLDFFVNSVLYSVAATVGMLISSIPAAYALARLRWRGSNVGFMLVIAAMMLPPQVVAVPLYSMWADLGLTGTLWPLIVPYLVGDAFSIFLLRQFFLTIPQDYLDAARVDGCSEFRILYQVLLPMIRPGIAAAALFTFLYTWNDYFGPLLYTGTNEESWTLSLGLSMFRNTHKVDWNLTMAATVLTILPVIVLFVFAQKTFIRGITFTGVK